MPHRSEVLRFGLFEVDLTEGVLIKNGRRIKLQEQPFRILAILLEHPGETVSREQLTQALWTDDTFVDFDRGLNAAMAKLRQALGDSADNPRFIETQARRGYRFIAPVQAPVETMPVPGPSPPKLRPPERILIWVAVAALSLLLIGAGILYYELHREQGGALSVSGALPPPVPLTMYRGFQWSPTFSPEGTRVAFAWDEPGKQLSNIYVKLIGASEPVRLTIGHDGDFAPAWSPDGRYIGFLRAHGPSTTAVMLIPSLGGPERELSRLQLDAEPFFDHRGWLPPGPLLAWSSDGKWLLATQETAPLDAARIVRISVESGEKTGVNLFADSFNNSSHGILPSIDAGFALSPDGKTLAFAHSAELPNSGLFVVNLSPDMLPIGQPRPLHFDRSYCGGIAWYPDGQNLVVSSDRRGSMEFWKVAVDSRHQPTRLDLSDANPGEIAVSKTGQRLVFTHYSGDSNIWRGELKNAHLTGGVPLIASTRGERSPAYSSDGKRIAFESDRSGNEEIWISSADGSQTLQLTSFGNARAGSPRWSPDDRQVAFDGYAAGKWDVYVIRSEGGKPVRFTQGSGSSIRPSWSHDGKWIYYCAWQNSGPQIWKKDAAGGPEIQVTKNGGCNQNESRDGAYVYYLKPDSRALWRVPAGGGDESAVLALTHGTEFAIGSHGAYLMETVTPAALRYLDFASGGITVLGMVPGRIDADRGLAVSPDERWLLYGDTELAGSQLMLVERFR
jgi:Tol biopolymer transport system component/DNA-binding winged helix-turn-helix (wHTH) protein